MFQYIVRCEYATEHRCGLKIKGKGLSSLITGTDPLKDKRPIAQCIATTQSDEEAIFTANLVNTLSEVIRKQLSSHEINIKRKEEGLPYTNLLLMRGCGQRLSNV